MLRNNTNQPSIVIGLGYKKQSGKDTVADMLVKDHGFVKLSFAAPLKELCALITDRCYDIIDQETYHSGLFAWLSKFGSPGVLVINSLYACDYAKFCVPQGSTTDVCNAKQRNLLQYIGTDLIRGYREDFWVDALFNGPLPDKLVVSDMRFANEFSRVETCGYPVLVNRNTGLTDNHESENNLNSTDWSYVIDNNGTLEELAEQVDDLYHSVWYNSEERNGAHGS